jgi:nucleotide-binding universal stress UspA family protein
MQEAIRKILIPIDFSLDAANALWLADRFAKIHDAQVFLLNVVTSENPVEVSSTETQSMSSKDRSEQAGVELRHFVRSILTRPISESQFLVDCGSAGDCIIHAVIDHEIDLIVMGTKGKDRTTPYWLGSTAAYIMEEAPCHVLVVPEKARKIDVKRALCATDLQESDPYRIWKTAQLLKAFSPELSCVHVHSSHNGTFHISMDELKSFLTITIPSIPVKFYEIVGITAWDSLNDFCMQNETDLLVVFKPFQGLLKTLLHRSVSRSLLLQTTVPLLILK